MSVQLYKNKAGKTLYPVCSWENNQHKLYNAHDRIMNDIYDARKAGEDTDDLYDQLDELERIICLFDGGVMNNGLVYATWEDGQRIKDYIWAYNARHLY